MFKNLNSIYLISKSTFQELIREKFFSVALFLTLIFIFLSLGLSNLSINEANRILADFGFWAMEVSSLAIVMFSGAYLLHKEIEKQTCLIILMKPISRDQFLIGKFSGLAMLIFMNLVFLLIILNFLFVNELFLVNSVFILFNIFLKILVILSLVFFLSIYTRPILSLLLGFSFYLYGHAIGDIGSFIKKIKNPNLDFIYKILDLLSPQFYKFNWKNYFFLKENIQLNQFLYMCFYFIIWILFLFLLTRKGFSKKNLQ